MTDEMPLIYTLGRRLEDQARRIAARRLPVYPWTRPLEVLLDHLTSLPAPFEGRFERKELPLAGSRPDIRSLGAQTAQDLPAIYMAPTEGRPLPADVQGRLREVTGRGAEALRVHDDGAADAMARVHRADAVTVGPDVFFRQGQFRPREPRGFGLLVHEATHVLELLRPGAAWRRATGGGVQEEEEAALARERAAVSRPAPVVGHGRMETGPRSRPSTLPAASAEPGAATWPAPPASPALRPMTAAADRDVSAPAPAPVDLEALRRDLVDDLMRQLRIESERGG